MLKSFAQKNLYFIIGCLVIVILVVLGLQSMNRTVEGLDGSSITEILYTPSTLVSNSDPVVPSKSGFYFKNDNYKPIYVLPSANSTINNFFQNNKLFNVDASNVLYSRNQNNTFNKYTYNNTNVLYESPFTGTFYECFKQMLSVTKPICYRYITKNQNTFIKIIFNYNGTNNADVKNTFCLKFNIKNSGDNNAKPKIDKVISDYLSKTHQVYSTGIVSGYLISLNKTDPANVKYTVIVNKTDGSKDTLTNVPKIVDDSALLGILTKDNIISIYETRNNAKYNLASSSESYIYGRISFGNSYCYSISQISKSS